jgi:hypothetical protein
VTFLVLRGSTALLVIIIVQILLQICTHMTSFKPKSIYLYLQSPSTSPKLPYKIFKGFKRFEKSFFSISTCATIFFTSVWYQKVLQYQIFLFYHIFLFSFNFLSDIFNAQGLNTYLKISSKFQGLFC